MAKFTYRCPATGYRVEAEARALPAASGTHTTYVAEHCSACGRLHFVNPATGGLMAQEASLRAEARPQPAAQRG